MESPFSFPFNTFNMNFIEFLWQKTVLYIANFSYFYTNVDLYVASPYVESVASVPKQDIVIQLFWKHNSYSSLFIQT